MIRVPAEVGGRAAFFTSVRTSSRLHGCRFTYCGPSHVTLPRRGDAIVPVAAALSPALTVASLRAAFTTPRLEGAAAACSALRSRAVL